MTTQQEILKAMSDVITIPKAYIKLTGCCKSAYVLSELIANLNEYTVRSYEEWHELTAINPRTLKDVFLRLSKKGWIEKKVKHVNNKPMLHAKPVIDKILEDLRGAI